MTRDDLPEFSAIWRATAEIYGRQPTDSAVAITFRVLARYTLDEIKHAIERHLADPDAGQYAPKPADIIRHIPGAGKNDGRPTADEAWTDALLAYDEHATVVWTDETAQASAVAWPILQEGDKVGARMAFRAAYERIVEKARENREPVRWTISPGRDVEGRRDAVERAIEQGKITEDRARAILPPPKAVSGGIAAIAGNIADRASGAATLGDSKGIDEHLRALREAIGR